MDCSTIIVSYNTFDFTSQAIATALDGAPNLESEVIVVDNNSPDRSAQRLRERYENFPVVKIIANTVNAGFSKANNQGASIAKGSVYFFLNPDTLVHADAISKLYHFLQRHANAGAVGPRVYNDDGSVQASIGYFPTWGRVFESHVPLKGLLRGHTPSTIPTPSETGPVDVVMGCALAVRKDVFDEVGGWDESFFMYSEETELCFKLQKLGYTNYYVREAEITHFGGASSADYYAEQQIVHQRSWVQFMRRNYGGGLVAWHRCWGLIGFAARAAIFPVLTILRPSRSRDYRKRGDAARKLLAWFVREYS